MRAPAPRCRDCGKVVQHGPRCAPCAAHYRERPRSEAGPILQAIYDAEMHGGVNWLWDGGFEWEVAVGDVTLDGVSETVEGAVVSITN